MTTPESTPDQTVPPDPVPTPEETAAQAAAAAAAADAAILNDQIRALATEIAKQTLLDFDPATIRKADVTASADTANPPTISIQISGDTTVTIPGVRYLDSYSPVVGDTILVFKQGTDLVALGQINDTPATPADQGWVTTGGVQYRKVLDNGELKVQFKGTFTVSGASLFTMNAGYIPSVTRTFTAGRNGESTSVLVQVASGTGAVTLVGGTQTLGTTDPGGNGANATGLNTGSGGNGANATGLNTGDGGVQTDAGGNGANATGLNTGGASAGTAHNHSMNNHGHSINDHSHWGGTHHHTLGSHGHSIDDHNHTLGNHGHSIDDHSHNLTLVLPTAVYFDSIEMFL